MKWTDLLAFRRTLREFVDWDDYVVHEMERLRNGLYYTAQLCDGSAVPALSLCHDVLTNLRFGLPHITQAEDLEEVPMSVLRFPHREVPGFENLPMFVRFNELGQTRPQRDQSMTEALAAVGDLGIFIKAAERCGGLEEFQDDLQVALKTMSELARAYADYLAPWI